MINILLVEDSPGDVEIVKFGLNESQLENECHTVVDGVEALEFLRKQNQFADAPTPDLVLLDINMPRMNGLEVLKNIREDPLLDMIPVVVLTTSGNQTDVYKAYKLHANAYIQKPLNASGFMDVVKKIDSFWLAMVKLPQMK